VVVDSQGGAVSEGHADLAADSEPDGSLHRLQAKYGVVLEGATRMLDRDAWTLRIDRSGDDRLVERWTVDARTGLVLGRTTYDPSGAVERSIVFTEVKEPYTPPDSELEPPPNAAGPPSSSQRWYGQPEVGKLAAGLRLPSRLPDGYQLRSGSSFKANRAPVVQLVYSDGLQEVSLFDQPGKLSGTWLPSGARKIKLRHGPGYAWEGFPRGTAWQAGAETYTLVGASPADELTEMANSLPQAAFRRTLSQRLGRILDWLRSRLT
jgi:negative regulator of sigma E activity